MFSLDLLDPEYLKALMMAHDARMYILMQRRSGRKKDINSLARSRTKVSY
jgi:hypothetical protein